MRGEYDEGEGQTAYDTMRAYRYYRVQKKIKCNYCAGVPLSTHMRTLRSLSIDADAIIFC